MIFACVPPACHIVDTSRVVDQIVSEPVARIALHNARTGTHKWALLDPLCSDKWRRQARLLRQLLE